MTDEEKQRVAKDLLDSALRAFEATVAPEVLQDVKLLLEMELMCTKGGADLLRRVAADPRVDRSGSVARDDGASVPAKASGDDQ